MADGFQVPPGLFAARYRETCGLPHRIRDKFVIADDGCWDWLSKKRPNEYASVAPEGRVYGRGDRTTEPAHRVVYKILVGDIPEGLDLDHLCRNRACVNPDHLEPVTTKVNVLRGVGACARNARKTHCPRGHTLEGDNLLLHKGGRARVCRECHRVSSLATYYRSKNRG